MDPDTKIDNLNEEIYELKERINELETAIQNCLDYENRRESKYGDIDVNSIRFLKNVMENKE